MRRRLAPTILLALPLLVTGCGDETPAAPPKPPASIPPDHTAARAELAALAALAQDHRFSALYDLDRRDGNGTRAVVATVAGDGSWRVDIPGGALGGTADVSIVQTGQGVYQCALANPACVRVAEPGRRVPKDADPKVQRVFRQWLSVFQDRQAPLSVVAAQTLPKAQGKCYAVDGISASMKPPVDVGIYCFADNGLLTAARVEFGTLTMVSVASPPARAELPGPVVGGEPLGMKSPPPPPPPSPDPSADPSVGASGAAG